jgi:hypothetical protein
VSSLKQKQLHLLANTHDNSQRAHISKVQKHESLKVEYLLLKFINSQIIKAVETKRFEKIYEIS